MEITPTRHVTIGRWTVPVPWLTALAVLALTAGLLAVVASPGTADHTEPGKCETSDLYAENASQDVKTPTGQAGLIVKWDMHCTPGANPDPVVFERFIQTSVNSLTITAGKIAFVYEQTGNTARAFSKEIHLPVEGLEKVCLTFTGEPGPSVDECVYLTPQEEPSPTETTPAS